MLSLLPATMLAEFDKCARPNGEWAGFDQVRTLRQAPILRRASTLTTIVHPCAGHRLLPGGSGGALRHPRLCWRLCVRLALPRPLLLRRLCVALLRRRCLWQVWCSLLRHLAQQRRLSRPLGHPSDPRRPHGRHCPPRDRQRGGHRRKQEHRHSQLPARSGLLHLSPNSPPPTLVAATDSGLSTGEIAGVAVGATVGGIVLLVVVGLVLRSLLFKSAMPVFTCLEKAPAEKKAPVTAGHV